jgi:hypothetical protein
MAEIVQHPSNPEPPPPKVQEPNGADEAEGPFDEEPEPGDFELETRQLLIMLKTEIGVRWMSLELRLQLETVELLLLERGCAPAT